MHYTYDRDIDFLYEDVRMPDKVWRKYQTFKGNLFKNLQGNKKGFLSQIRGFNKSKKKIKASKVELKKNKENSEVKPLTNQDRIKRERRRQIIAARKAREERGYGNPKLPTSPLDPQRIPKSGYRPARFGNLRKLDKELGSSPLGRVPIGSVDPSQRYKEVRRLTSKAQENTPGNASRRAISNPKPTNEPIKLNFDYDNAAKINRLKREQEKLRATRRIPSRAKLKNDVYKYRPGGYRFKKASKVESGEGSISSVGSSAPKKFNFQRELNLPKKSTRNEPSYKKTVTSGDIAKKSAGMSSEPTEMDYKKTKIIDRNSKYKFSRKKTKDVLPNGIGYVQDNLEKRRKRADKRRKYGLAHKANYPYGGGLIGRIVGPASELDLPKKARVSRSKLRRINSNTGLDKVSRYNAVQGLAYRQQQNINKYL